MTRHFIPVFIEACKLKIIVFGGGKVALRKCDFFREAEITVMAREILPELKAIVSRTIVSDIPDDVKQIIDSYDMVIAATDDKELNCRIRDDALYMGINVNSAHGGGNILIPSVLSRDGFKVAVSSEGRNPSFPPYVVNELESFFDEKYDRMLDLMVEMRAVSKERIAEQKDRQAFQQAIINDRNIWDLVAAGDMDAARKEALKKGGF